MNTIRRPFTRLAARLRREEQGAVLVMAMGFIAFVGVLCVAVLNYSANSYKATVSLRPVRDLQFAADGAIEGAINKVRLDPSLLLPCGVAHERFYRADPPLNDLEIAVTAQCASPGVEGDFDATFTARQCALTDSSAVCNAKPTLVAAEVNYLGTSNVTTEVLSWSAIPS